MAQVRETVFDERSFMLLLCYSKPSFILFLSALRAAKSHST